MVNHFDHFCFMVNHFDLHTYWSTQKLDTSLKIIFEDVSHCKFDSVEFKYWYHVRWGDSTINSVVISFYIPLLYDVYITHYIKWESQINRPRVRLVKEQSSSQNNICDFLLDNPKTFFWHEVLLLFVIVCFSLHWSVILLQHAYILKLIVVT